MKCLKDMCIIQEGPQYWYSTNKSVHHPRMPKFLLRLKTGTYTFGYNKRWATLQLCLPIVYTHHKKYMKDMCITEKIYSNNTPHTSPFTILGCPNSCSDSKQGHTFGYNKRWETLQLCLPSVCTHHMNYIKDMCIIQERPQYWYSTNKSVPHPRMSKFLLTFETGTYVWL